MDIFGNDEGSTMGNRARRSSTAKAYAGRDIRKTKAQHAGIGHTCGECSVGVWDLKFINRDTNGKPFLKRCPYCTAFNGARLKDEKACEKFKQDGEQDTVH